MLRSNLHLAAFHRRKLLLTDANVFVELLLHLVKARVSPNCGYLDDPADRNVFASRFFPLTSSSFDSARNLSCVRCFSR
jgi:hypothetical protein